MKLRFYILLIFPLLLLMSSCEDPITVNLDAATPELSVDGWIYSDTSFQKIELTKTTQYFDTTTQPRVRGAVVSVLDLTDSTRYPFTETAPGTYTTNSFKPVIGRNYRLNIISEGVTWKAEDRANRVPVIDSLQIIKYTEADGGPGFKPEPDDYQVILFARDFEGQGDYYKFDIYSNGTRAMDINNIDIIDDKFADGLVFIPPVNFPLNENPYKPNDTLEVRILSLSSNAYAFWTEVNTQLNNTSGLFAQVPTNVRTNIYNITPGSKATAVGYFGASGVSRKVRIVGQPQ